MFHEDKSATCRRGHWTARIEYEYGYEYEKENGEGTGSVRNNRRSGGK